MLPSVDGLELLTRLKASERFRDLPVIMATAKGSESDKVCALDMGADDYLTKPFGMMEMVSRVKAVLRRVYPKQGDGLLRMGELAVNLREHRVCLAGETIQLTAKEFDLLKLLLSHPGEVFNREQLRQMLAMLEQCPEPKTLTNVGKLMGCSRQNIKKLAAVLAQKGYLTMTEGANNAVCLEETEKVAAYSAQMAERRSQVMQLLFADFSEEEISHFYSLNRKLYVAFSPIGLGASLPGVENVVAALRGTPRDTGIDLAQLNSLNADFKALRKKYAEFSSALVGVDVGCLQHQIPGGMLTNLESQLKNMKAFHRLDEVLQEAVQVRADMGYPPLATPSSQMCGTQATTNVLTGKRYGMISKEMTDYCRGMYGQAPGPISPDLMKAALGGEKPITCRPAELLAPGWEEACKAVGDLAECEEDVLTYALFPSIAPKFLEEKRRKAANCVSYTIEICE